MRGRQDQKAASEVADASRRKTDLCSRCSLAASAMLAQGENALATLPSASTVILAQPPWDTNWLLLLNSAPWHSSEE
ncbi:uncharacterized protein LOC142568265 isoform X3 [Dermacentor variabilis]|uniref:uncharacterized protein LOC142568265 isoform X3 n=2 Tax=Dermacentor variabilis TaxID=34621 RepID=UPI003F5BA975